MRGERAGGRRAASDVVVRSATGTDGSVAAQPNAWKALGQLAELVRRSHAPQLGLRLFSAILMTLAGKGLGVLAPLVLGAAVNRLSEGQSVATTAGVAFAGLAIGWAIVRLLSAIAPNASDVLFAPVRAAAQREAASETFAHALSLSLDFHQSKRSGALSRIMDRGSRAVDFLMRILAFNLVPTGVELALAAGVLAARYDWRFWRSRGCGCADLCGADDRHGQLEAGASPSDECGRYPGCRRIR